MALTASTLQRLAALRLPPEAMGEVLSIFADALAVEEERLEKQRDRKRRQRGQSRDSHGTVTGRGRDESEDTARTTPALSLSPHTPLNPNPSPKENPPKGGQKKTQAEVDFDQFRAAYPKRQGSNPWEPAREKFDRAVRSGANPVTVIAGAKRYAAECDRLNKTGTELVMQAKTWLNQKCWQDYAALELAVEGVEIRKSDPRWTFMTARWERENGKPFPHLADKWPFPESWLRDANQPSDAGALPEFLDRRQAARA